MKREYHSFQCTLGNVHQWRISIFSTIHPHISYSYNITSLACYYHLVWMFINGRYLIAYHFDAKPLSTVVSIDFHIHFSLWNSSISDEWIATPNNSSTKPTKIVKIQSLSASEHIALQRYLRHSYGNTNLLTTTCASAKVATQAASTLPTKKLRKPPKSMPSWPLNKVKNLVRKLKNG